MLFEINEYVRICSDCQRVYVHHHKLYDKFNFILSSDENSFHIIIMNFIIDMSSTRNLYINKINDAILMLMNKLTKHATYIATIKNLNVKNFASWHDARYNFEQKFVIHESFLIDVMLIFKCEALT